MLNFPLRIGISLAPNDAGPAAAADVEARGFDLLVLADHAFHYRFPERPFLDAWMRLAAITQTTSRIRLGTLVTNLSWRQPVILAKNTIALDHLSGGRFELGVGCGAYPDQAMLDTFTMPSGERVRRLDEGLVVLDRLLRGDTQPFSGEFTSYQQAEVAPGCAQQPRPPLLVAAAGPRALGVAAQRADIWNCYLGDPDLEVSVTRLAACTRTLDAHCVRIGRDPATLRRSLLIGPVSPDPWAHDNSLQDVIERFRPLGFTDFIAFSPPPEASDVYDHVTQELPAMRRSG
jgi:alkanesulfonate monooxygenase SsuD/methylene tetrahydromethanopterin reductase-like flavin-dependent oxidoreductase (luciferase family)